MMQTGEGSTITIEKNDIHTVVNNVFALRICWYLDVCNVLFTIQHLKVVVVK